MAAGAAAGALGCIAAAALISPVAISALPLWSVIGSAVAGILPGPAPRPGALVDAVPEAQDRGDTVRAAALWSLLLELQGSSEARITAVLQQTLDPDDGAALVSADDAQRWLDGVRHQFDLAMTREVHS